MKRLTILFLALSALAACHPKARDAVSANALPDIYPDYVGVTVPATIAPLDFTIQDAQALDVLLTAPDGTELRSREKGATHFSESRWKQLLRKSVNDSIQVSVSALQNGKWT